MTGDREFTVDDLRIGVDPASVRVVENSALPSGVALVAANDGRVTDFFRIKPIEIKLNLDTEGFRNSLRLLGQAFGKAFDALHALRVVGLCHSRAVQRPRSPGPAADAANQRLYTAQRHVYRRALRRQRRHPVPRFDNRRLLRELYVPNTVICPRPDSLSEARHPVD